MHTYHELTVGVSSVVKVAVDVQFVHFAVPGRLSFCNVRIKSSTDNISQESDCGVSCLKLMYRLHVTEFVLQHELTQTNMKHHRKSRFNLGIHAMEYSAHKAKANTIQTQ